MKIHTLDAFQIYDSRGNPTLEVEVVLEDGSIGSGMVPSGASTGQFEALELRDNEPGDHRGKSVRRAIGHVREEIALAVCGVPFSGGEELDRFLCELDGTDGKARLGANAILGVSMAFSRALAASRNLPLFASLGDGGGTLLPLPEIQIIGGGAHANWRTDVQDYLVIANGARSYEETLSMTFSVYHACADLLRERGAYFGVADEGGFWPEFDDNEGPMRLIMEGIRLAGYEPGRDISLSLDIAASDLFDEASGCYRFRLEGRTFSPAEFGDLMLDWCRRYPVITMEDPAADTDWTTWQRLRQEIGDTVQLVGDDLFTTNITRIREGIERDAANSVLIKLNQIGTVTETIEAIQLCQSAGWLPVVSARSGETEDAFISHLAVATNAGQLKVGSFARSERMVKWNECLRIARALGDRAKFRGGQVFQQLQTLKPSK
jgi:enolase